MRKTLTNSYLWLTFFLIFTISAHGQERTKHYDPEKGFAPAQNDLTKVFLKLAESLEHEGTPEPYIRHVLAEHARIDAKYEQATGKKGSARPKYFTDDYRDNLLTNWKRLEEPLQLEQLCRDSGRYMRHAILGSWHKTPDDLVLEEENLSEAEKKEYRSLVSKVFFEKSDFAAMERFYKDGGGYDKLSELGREQMSLRTHLGTLSPEKRKKYFDDHAGGTVIVTIFNEYQRLLVADINAEGERKVNSETLEGMLSERLLLGQEKPDLSKLDWIEKDAVRYAHLVKLEFVGRSRVLDEKIKGDTAKLFRSHLDSMRENLSILAYSELLASIREGMIDE